MYLPYCAMHIIAKIMSSRLLSGTYNMSPDFGKPTIYTQETNK